ncbi:hypothetical protein O181_003369 [Austropuccinia psidii MF-1]|uniref:Uncharacterized protein n=1 Tax=Austropuccinia psidii MF-1 TaxID=1389203 RepID=A0A9Q3BE94_9BASI|nr:hypothetical protein [Austropuccinia psidii MF-1]
MRRIANSPTDPNAEGSDELDGEEIEVVPHSIGHQSSTSPSHHASRIFQSQVIPMNHRDFQPVLSTIPSSIPPPSPNLSTSMPALVSLVMPEPIPNPRDSPMVNSQQLQPVARSSQKREYLSPLPFLPPNYFSEGKIDLSGLQENIQI